MWNFRQVILHASLLQNRAGGMLKKSSWLNWTIVAGLPTIHWLTLSMPGPISEPKQILYAALWCSSPLCGCLPPPTTPLITASPPAKMAATKEKKKTLRAKKMKEFVWQKLHLVCYWFFLLPRHNLASSVVSLSIISGTLLKMNSDPTWTINSYRKRPDHSFISYWYDKKAPCQHWIWSSLFHFPAPHFAFVLPLKNLQHCNSILVPPATRKSWEGLKWSVTQTYTA